jgi:hypothetical protein
MKALYDKSAKFRPQNPSCFLYYVTTGTWNNEPDLLARVAAEISDLKKTGMFSQVRFFAVGAPQIHSWYRQSKNSISREFIWDKKVVVPEVSGVTAAYLGFLPAKDLLKLMCDEDGSIIKSLFYENVRDFLGVEGINGEILTTLTSGNSDRFILMNNGVTMIARLLSTTGDKFVVGDYQVVNGCQTSHVLHACQAQLPDSVRIPFRLVHTQNDTVIEDVIRATNRQTEVKDDQFFAMKDFAKKLEAYFKTFPVESRLYYERRPHQYDAQDIEKIRIITHQNLVRSVGAMFLGLPHVTTRRFRDLSAKVGKDMFVDTDKPEPYYVAALALYRLEQLFKNKKVDTKYKAARFQLLLVVRMLIDPSPLPKMNAHDMTKRSLTMAEYLQNEQACENIFNHSIQVIESLATNWGRDTIRNEPITKAIFQKYGQHYPG